MKPPSREPEYIAWVAMHRRCNDPKYHRYDRYGGRGIKVCDRWESFAAFLEDMGRKLSPSYTLERKNNDADYEPKNCVWASRKAQARNRLSNRMLTFKGKTKTLVEWAEIRGISAKVIEGRLRICGYSVERALTQPYRGWGPGRKKVRGD